MFSPRQFVNDFRLIPQGSEQQLRDLWTKLMSILGGDQQSVAQDGAVDNTTSGYSVRVPQFSPGPPGDQNFRKRLSEILGDGAVTQPRAAETPESESGGSISWGGVGPLTAHPFSAQVAKFTGKPAGPYDDLLNSLRYQLETELMTNFGEIPGYAGSGDAGRQRAGMLASLLTAMQNAQKVGSESADPLAKERLQAESNERIAQTAADATRFRATEGRTATENSARTRGEGQLDKAQYDALAELINADPPPDPSDPEFAKWLMRMMFKRRFLSGDMGGEQEVQQG